MGPEEEKERAYVLDCEGVLTPSLIYSLRHEIGMDRIFDSLMIKDGLAFAVCRTYDMLMRCIGSKSRSTKKFDYLNNVIENVFKGKTKQEMESLQVPLSRHKRALLEKLSGKGQVFVVTQAIEELLAQKFFMRATGLLAARLLTRQKLFLD